VRSVIYARYSTDRQSEASIDDQLRVCREFAAARGLTVSGEHVDRGISGAALGNRPGAQAALEQLVAGDVLVVNDITRLSRSQDLAPLLARLRHRGVRVLGVQDGYDSDARSARMHAGLSGIMSEEFRANIADRTRSALAQLARAGESAGGKVYADVPIVREIFARYAANESLRAIVNDLNRRGVPSPGAGWKSRRGATRGKWMMSAVHAMLRNERYVGRVIWNRSQWVKDPDSGKRQRRERPREEWIETRCEPIVDQGTWERVQGRFRTNAGRGGVPSYLLSGLLACGLCGGKLIVVGGQRHRRYGCAGYHGGGEHACAMSTTVRLDVAETHILEPVVATLLAPEAELEGVRQMRAERAAAEAPEPAQDEDMATLERLVREGALSREVAAPAIAEARRRAEARRAAPREGLPWPSATSWRAIVGEMCELLRGPDVIAARAALREIVGEIRCVPEGEFLVAEIEARKVHLATGTNRAGIWVGSGGLQRIYMPTRHR
jgi:site-specific DNA recombinase